MNTLDMSLVNSWVMYRSNMQGKGEKNYLSHREFNYVIAKKLTLFAKWPIATCTTKSGVRNAHMLHYNMMWSGHKERKRRSVEHVSVNNNIIALHVMTKHFA